MLDELHSKKSGRSTEVQHRYQLHNQKLEDLYGENPPCPFCDPDVHMRRLVRETPTMLVVENDFPYEFFDNREVAEHLMIVSRRHIGEYSDFSEDEQRDYWGLLSDYQGQKYAIYTRAMGDVQRSVPIHLHTHAVSYVE